MALTKATHRMTEGAPINVKDYGATGDGTTDDTVAIQAALDVGDNIVVEFPAGTYKLTSALEVDNSNTILRGYGATLNMVGTTGSWVEEDVYAILINGAIATQQDVIIEGFKFTGSNNWGGIFSAWDSGTKGWDGAVFGNVNEGNYTNTRTNFTIRDTEFTSPYYEAIDLTNTQIRVSGCKITDHQTGGASARDVGAVRARFTKDIVFEDIEVVNGYGKGVSTSYVDGVQYNNITVRVDQSYSQGLYIGHFNRNSTVTNCSVLGNAGMMKVSYNADTTTISNCIFEGSGYLMLQGAQNTTVDGCIIKTTGKRALQLYYHSTWGDRSVDNCVVSDCQISSTDTVGEDEDHSLKVVDVGDAYDTLISNCDIKGNIYARPMRDVKIQGCRISFTKTGAWLATRLQGVIYLRSLSKSDTIGLQLINNKIYTDNDKQVAYLHGDTNPAYVEIVGNLIVAPNLTSTATIQQNYATDGRIIYSNNTVFTPNQTAEELSYSFSGTYDAKISKSQPNLGSEYTVTNDSTDRTYDANSTTVDELADVLGTLITDLQVSGILR
jgi:hypothetical protein